MKRGKAIIGTSTTQVVSGAVLGAGAARNVRAVRWGVAKDIGIVWVVTIPAAALVGAGVYAVMSIDGRSDVGPVIVTALGAVAICAVMRAARNRTRSGESVPLPPAAAPLVRAKGR